MNSNEMKEPEYYLIIFDRDYDHDNLVEEAIEKIWSTYYRNRAIKLSTHVLLVKPDPKYIGKECSVEYFAEEALYEIAKKHDLNYSDLDVYVIPVELNSILHQISKFEAEINYIKELDK